MVLVKVEIRFLKKSCDHTINESHDSVDQAPSAFLFIYLFYLFHLKSIYSWLLTEKKEKKIPSISKNDANLRQFS